jgi:hypothetical protein
MGSKSWKGRKRWLGERRASAAEGLVDSFGYSSCLACILLILMVNTVEDVGLIPLTPCVARRKRDRAWQDTCLEEAMQIMSCQYCSNGLDAMATLEGEQLRKPALQLSSNIHDHTRAARALWRL